MWYKKMWNMFKVNNNGARTTYTISFAVKLIKIKHLENSVGCRIYESLLALCVFLYFSINFQSLLIHVSKYFLLIVELGIIVYFVLYTCLFYLFFQKSLKQYLSLPEAISRRISSQSNILNFLLLKHGLNCFTHTIITVKWPPYHGMPLFWSHRN